MNTKKRIKTVWEITTFDVWGNDTDGYTVNDVASRWEETIFLCVQRHNIGTPQEFESAHPNDRQVRRALGCARIQLDCSVGDDLEFNVDRAKDGYPLATFRCLSHASLSPIKTLNP